MYTTIIHPLRKYYLLSIPEYCVLDAVRSLSHEEKYGFWCVMPIPEMAENLDFDERTIQLAYKKLEEIGLLKRRRKNKTDTAVRCVDEWVEWFGTGKADVMMLMKTGNCNFIGISPKLLDYAIKTNNESMVKKIHHLQSNGEKISPSTVKNFHLNGEKISPNTYIYINNDTNNISKEIGETPNTIQEDDISLSGEASKKTEYPPDEQKKCSYGNNEINAVVAAIKEQTGLPMQSVKNSRGYIYNLIRNIKKAYPGHDAVLLITKIIEMGMKLNDNWHSTKMNDPEHLFRHWQEIVQKAKTPSKVQQGRVAVIF